MASKVPPGPRPLPVLGNLLEIAMGASPIDVLYKYQKQYGNIFTVYFGSQKTVILCGHEMIKDAFVTNSEHFSNRPDDLFIWNVIFKNKGIAFDNHFWQNNRRITLTALKDFGCGMKSLEEKVYEEIGRLCEVLDTKEGQTFDIKHNLAMAFSNVICTIVFGTRFEYESANFHITIDALHHIAGSIQTLGFILNDLPWLRFVPPIRQKFQELVRINRKLEDFIQNFIDEHRKTYDSSCIRDFIDAFLPYDDLTSGIIIKDLFAAGTETSSTTAAWTALFISHYPNVQMKCRQEITQVLGNAMPQNKHRELMPYVQATIQETLRLKTTLPLGVPHIVSENIQFAGFDLKKGTGVIAFLDSAHHDPAVWGPDHDQFRPERWLDAEGKLIKIPAFIPFSTGKRQCLGESVARMSMHLFIATLIQRYEFLIPQLL